MSVKITSQVWEWSKAEGTSLLVLLALADFCDDDGYCFPGMSRIAKKSRTLERTLQRHIHYLQTIGELEIQIGEGIKVAGERGHGYTNRFRVTCRKGVSSVTPLTEKGVSSMTEGGVIAMSPKPSVESSVVLANANTSGEASSPPVSFEKKRGRAKANQTLTQADLAAMAFPSPFNAPSFMAAMEAWRTHKAKRGEGITRYAMELTFKRCQEWGLEASLRYVEFAISNNFKNLQKPLAAASPVNSRDGATRQDRRSPIPDAKPTAGVDFGRKATDEELAEQAEALRKFRARRIGP